MALYGLICYFGQTQSRLLRYRDLIIQILPGTSLPPFQVVNNQIRYQVVKYGLQKQTSCFEVSMDQSCCPMTVIVLSHYLAVPWIGLLPVTVTFPGHTHLLHFIFVCLCLPSCQQLWSYGDRSLSDASAKIQRY